jgi:hypothetical protein
MIANLRKIIFSKLNKCDFDEFIYIFFYFTMLSAPIKLIKAVTLMTCIREVLGSNLGWDTDYPDSFCDFTVPPLKYGGITLNYATTTSFHSLSNSLSSIHSTHTLSY